VKLRFLRWLVLIGCCCNLIACAQVPVTVRIDPAATHIVIPADFLGLSFEISNLLPDRNGQYLFSATNQPLVHLFRNIGIKNLRVGGGTAELPNYAVPGPADIDQLFAFAQAADVRVIYTLRLLNGDKTNAATLAKYIADHYASRLECFCLGNEPDWHAYHSYPGHSLDPAISETVPGGPGSAYPSYLLKWKEFAAEIIHAVPVARFGGPDTGSNYPVPGAKNTEYRGKSWTEQFVDDGEGSHRLVGAFLHDYVGQDADGVSAQTAIDAMLSRAWQSNNNMVLFNHVLAPVQARSLTYRLTECNDYTGGVEGASNGFASALWALDYLHWHAARGASGINFHNKRWIRTCTVYRDPSGAFRVNPKAYGLKAFSLGSRGSIERLSLENPQALNLTAYSVRDADQHWLTVINKEHGPKGRAAKVIVRVEGASKPASLMLLQGSGGNASATTGITLGGGTISADNQWLGHWQPVTVKEQGYYAVNVPALTAAVIAIPVE
jgi:hypothetical protein